jgi:HPt (histidine-containing phosphotransfer) domain-containing protein
MPAQHEKPLPADYKIDGLDIQKGIRNLYFEVLRSFAVNTRTLLKALREASADKPESYLTVIHGIKGSSRGVCAEAIGNRAAAIEKAAKSGDFDYVLVNLPAFIRALDVLLTSIEEMFVKTDLPKAERDEPDRELLVKLLKACREHNMDGVYAAASELSRYEYDSDNALVEWLKEQTDRFNLKEVAKRLSGMALE